MEGVIVYYGRGSSKQDLQRLSWFFHWNSFQKDRFLEAHFTLDLHCRRRMFIKPSTKSTQPPNINVNINSQKVC